MESRSFGGTSPSTMMVYQEQQKKLAIANQKLKLAETASQKADETVSWCQEVLALFDRLETRGRLGFQVYIDVDGEKVVVLATGDDVVSTPMQEFGDASSRKGPDANGSMREVG